MVLVLNQHMWTTVRKHLLGVVGSVPFGSISSMMRVPQVTESVFTEYVTPAPADTYTEPFPVIEYMTPSADTYTEPLQ